MTHIAHLKSRALLLLTGNDVVDFLQNLITCDIEKLDQGEITFGALLTPQGKILFDFFIYRSPEGFLVDVDATQREALARRLMFYKLRADVSIALEDKLIVAAAWDGPYEGASPDPRSPDLGLRFVTENLASIHSEADWHALRIQACIPHSGEDFELGEAFPHETLMDQFAASGVDFSKGCYVGQEVVSRMHHRGTARNRIIKVTAKNPLPAPKTPLMSGGKRLGSMGSSEQNFGLALVRLDRAKRAMDDNQSIMADETVVELSLPDFATFGWK